MNGDFSDPAEWTTFNTLLGDSVMFMSHAGWKSVWVFFMCTNFGEERVIVLSMNLSVTNMRWDRLELKRKKYSIEWYG